MRATVKWVLVALASLAIVAGLAVAYIAATFDPNDYKADIVRLVKEKTGRTLELKGDIRLTFYPTLGMKLGEASLSERNNARPFASLAEAVVAVKLMPLLSKQVVVDAIEVKGLRAAIVKERSGRYNFDDLTGADAKEKETPPASALNVDIDHVTITDAEVTYLDHAAGAQYRLSRVNIKTGRVAPGVTTPLEFNALVASGKHKAELDTKIKGKLTVDSGRENYKLDAAELSAKGAFEGWSAVNAAAQGAIERSATGEIAANLRSVTFSGTTAKTLKVKLEAPRFVFAKEKIEAEKVMLDVSDNQPKKKLAAKAALTGLQGTMKAVKATALEADVDSQANGRTIKARITGAPTGSPETQRFELNNLVAHVETQSDGRVVKANLGGKLTGNGETKRIDLPNLTLDATVRDPTLPNGGFDVAIKGAARVDLARENGALDFAGRLDQSNVNGKAAVTRFSPLAMTFDVNADQLDADRLLGNAPAGKTAAVKPPAGSGAPGRPKDDTIDLAALKGVNAAGSLKIGKLTLLNLRSSQVRADLKIANGRLDIAPLTAQLYQGTLNGTLSAQAASSAIFSAKQTLAGVAVGQLLRDAAKIDTLEGKGTIDVDLTTRGATVEALKKALTGKAAVNLADGSIKGVDIAGTIRTAKTTLGQLRGQQVESANMAQKTDFTELKATFDVNNGVARNSDFSMKSPLLRLGGAGDLDIGNDRMNYLLKATVVATSKGQGGKDLADLSGLTVPVKLTGPLAAPRYSIDFAGMATDFAKREVEQELLRRAAGQKSDGNVRDRLLKGILGR